MTTTRPIVVGADYSAGSDVLEMMTGQTLSACQEDQADGALSSAAVTRPSASFLMPLRRAPPQPIPHTPGTQTNKSNLHQAVLARTVS